MSTSRSKSPTTPQHDLREKEQRNPFPSSAVARLTSGAEDYLTLKTRAVRDAEELVTDYLSRSQIGDEKTSADGSTGAAVAVIGEYGTGKTHIAREILRSVQKSDVENLHSFYLDAPADTFLSLYRDRFVPKLERKEVRARVNEFYADIVADHLEDSKPHAELVASLRARTVDPSLVERDLGLPRSKLERALIERLKLVTEQEDFGTALALFMDPDFEDPVWEWIRGFGLDDGLRECGVTDFIGSDSRALAAIGVMAFLFGRQRHRFVLVIDEMEKVLSYDTAPSVPEETVLAFKKLLEVCGQMRSLVVLCGLPDFFEILADDVQQRFNLVIRPGGLKADEITEYVKGAQKRILGRERLKPFTAEIIAYVAQLTGGNARKVIRLLFHSWRAAQSRGTVVNQAMVREVAREQFEVTSTEDVDAALTRIADRNGWVFERQKSVDDNESLKVDFWLPVGQDGAGCMVIVTRSILLDKEAEEIAARGKALASDTKSKSPRKSVLVINGYVSDPLVTALEQGFDRVVVYNLRSFADDVDAVLSGLRSQVEEQAKEDILQVIKQQIATLTRQTRNLSGAIDDLSRFRVGHHDIIEAVDYGVRRIFGQLGSSSNQNQPPPQLIRTESVFAKVLALLQSLDEKAPVLGDSWGFMQTAQGFDTDRRMSDEPLGFLGFKPEKTEDILRLLQETIHMVNAFKTAIYEIGRQHPEPIESFVDRLQETCMLFDQRGKERDVPDLLARFADQSRRADPERVYRTLRDLGKDVYHATKDDMEIYYKEIR